MFVKSSSYLYLKPIALVSLLSLTSYHNSEAASTTPLVRQLTLPSVSGLSYSGNQQTQGVTGTKGEFYCHDQETLTFKLGATTLGSYQCERGQSATVSLMRLANLNLSNHQLFSEMLSAQLTLKALPYNQWENRLALLQVLDSNQRLEDGVQLKSTVNELSLLKTNPLDFNRDENHFKSILTQIVQQATLVKLYQNRVVAEVASPARLFKALETESQGQFKFTGYVLTDFMEESEDGVLYEHLSYNKNGFPIKMYYTDSAQANENWQALFKYDAQKHIKQVIEKSAGESYHYAYTYEPTQDYLQQIIGSVMDGSNLASPSFIKTWRKNKRNQYTSIVEQEVLDEERVKSKNTYHYDTYARLDQVQSRIDYIPLGSTTPSSTSSSLVKVAYDGAGNKEQASQTATDTTGQVTTTAVTWKFDSLGQLQQQAYQVKMNTSLTANQMDYVYTSAGSGKAAKKQYWENGVLIGYYQDSFEYNHSSTALTGGLTQQQRDYYNMKYQNGRKPLRSIIATYRYDESGRPARLLETLIEYQDGYGVVFATPEVYKILTQFAYDTAGNLHTIQTDYDEDSQVDLSYTFIWKAVNQAPEEELDQTLQLMRITNQYSYLSEDPNTTEDLKIDLYLEAANSSTNKLAILRQKTQSAAATAGDSDSIPIYTQNQGQYTSALGQRGTGSQSAATAASPMEMSQMFP